MSKNLRLTGIARGAAGCWSRTIVTRPKKPLGLRGPVVYCPECLRKNRCQQASGRHWGVPVPAASPAAPARLKHGKTAERSKIAKLG